jgi:hypothetical protein
MVVPHLDARSGRSKAVGGGVDSGRTVVLLFRWRGKRKEGGRIGMTGGAGVEVRGGGDGLGWPPG